MEVRIEHRTTQRVAFLRHIGPYQQVGPTWERLCQWAGQQGLMGKDTKMFGRSWDDPDTTPPDQIRYDACIAVGQDVAAASDPAIDHTWAGSYAVALHEGPWEGLARTYGAIHAWVAEHGHTAQEDQPCLEIYMNDPSSTAPADLRTEICLPLQG